MEVAQPGANSKPRGHPSPKVGGPSKPILLPVGTFRVLSAMGTSETVGRAETTAVLAKGGAEGHWLRAGVATGLGHDDVPDKSSPASPRLGQASHWGKVRDTQHK